MTSAHATSLPDPDDGFAPDDELHIGPIETLPERNGAVDPADADGDQLERAERESLRRVGM